MIQQYLQTEITVQTNSGN